MWKQNICGIPTSWNEKKEDHCWRCDSLYFKRENKYYNSCTLKSQDKPSGVGVFCCWSPAHKGQNGWALLSRISLFCSEQGLADSLWVRAHSTWTVTDPCSPPPLLGHTMHHRSPIPHDPPASPSISLQTLSPCLFSQIVTKGRGHRVLYLFTTWWHHL